ncbi:hypothetical protein CPB86DRAFT_769982 [Serendipita vermifera]|nr:hypothetical protein CPB86DRAFT_769982 [Serendipita vermifera]
MLPNEILAYDADILCLQEVDQLDVLLPALKSRYSHIYASGRSKNHGCMVLYKPEYFELISERTVYYDEEDIRVGTPEGMASADQAAIWRKGVSRKTGNIALLVGLRNKRNPAKGFVVGTTHLFWHGAFTAERTKQMIILLREMAAFRNEIGAERWPYLNLPPDDITYSMLVGETVTESQYEVFNESRVVHVSIDPSIGHTEESKLEDEENDPDRKIWNCRPCTDADGLLRADELEDMFKQV